MRYTIAVHESLIEQANNLAAFIGAGPEDMQTFGASPWRNSEGAAFALASFVGPSDLPSALKTSLARPDWDVDGLVDLGAATAALAVLDLPDPETASAPMATKGRIAVVPRMEGPAAISALGLSYPKEEED
ncbi:hypothetical protein [Antarctobacter heliothermus]|uniref:Uncharacterized protein n=1 Tax=Antarctobacter heliothermus TaxID=74033 RepID=A0A239DBA5_9RHOB|nr:hypothetical protein [Antarctobacter heliothermus]SNS29134.1 hypothetical protein SAMN04488078_101020 [Antarctobacter heliothermus]